MQANATPGFVAFAAKAKKTASRSSAGTARKPKAKARAQGGKKNPKKSKTKRKSTNPQRPWWQRPFGVTCILVLLLVLIAARVAPQRSAELLFAPIEHVFNWLNPGEATLDDGADSPTPWPPVLSGRPPNDVLETQIALARIGFSPGSVDGHLGQQTTEAILAFQHSRGLPASGLLDNVTAASLLLTDPVFTAHTVSPADFATLRPAKSTWRGRAELDKVGYHSILERLAEKSQSSPNLLRSLNPSIDWESISTGTSVRLPKIQRLALDRPIHHIRIRLSARTLQAFDSEENLLLHFPVSIARDVDKRPLGRLEVRNRAENPNYTFNPAIFPDAAAREGISSRMIIPPGPNNPVGTVWIGLSRPSYGIHGTPAPELVGRTESSGCFRLANWNAETLLHHIQVGTPVYIEE